MLINIGIVVEEKIQTREMNLRTDPPMHIGQRNYKWESKRNGKPALPRWVQ